jgi:hypothetical protein
MRIKLTILFIIGTLLIIGGFIGKKLDSSIESFKDFTPMFSNNHMYEYFSEDINESDKLDLEEMTILVEEFIAGYKNELLISDVFVFEDTETYFSIVEEDTGIGAMELLVNQYTGEVYPEYGPNMMWNTKYGMHGNGAYGMMGSGMMSGFRSREYDLNQTLNDNNISLKSAIDFAEKYIEKYSKSDLSISGEGHEFYGYYTLHVDKEGETVGMLSVNAQSGEVWYHSWHGEVIEVLGSHENDEH